MSTLYIRLPSKAASGNAPPGPDQPCEFALVSNENRIERQGEMTLPGLSDAIAKAERVVLLLAAVDVTLLRVKTPALLTSRLKAALPNLVEDQLITDPAECAVVAGGMSDGLRTVAVVHRDWLNTLNKALIALGARQVAALPAQLCLPYQGDQPGQPRSVTAAINKIGDTIDAAIRLSEHEGIGLAIGAGQNESSSAHEVIETLCAVVPEASIDLYVPQSEESAFQETVKDNVALNKRIKVSTDNWSRWISGASGTALDVMAGLGSRSVPKLELRAWCWPLALAAAVLIVNVAALNIDWWRMKNEAHSLRTSMVQIYKSAFPKETVIIDPVAQMEQKVAAARSNAGLAAPDDFSAITAAFGEAWSSVTPESGKPAIAALEYRERSLLVRLKPLAAGSPGGGQAPMQQVQAALAEHKLSLEQVPSESDTVWKIRSAK